MTTLARLSLAAALALGPLAAPAAEPEAAKEAVRGLVTEAHEALSGAGDVDRLRAAIERGFALDLWGRYLLTDVEDQLSEEQKTTVEGLLPGFLADLYRDQFARGLDEPPSLGEVEALRRDDVMVDVVFPRPGGKRLPTDMRVRPIDGEPKVIDIMVGGASFLRLKRDEFAQIVRDGGPDALIAHLRENGV
ncbi:MAG: ABC transporter substrate-binding protein [Paracoccaceae bacterium]